MSASRNPFDRLEEIFEQLSRQFEDAARGWEGDRFGTGGMDASRLGIDLADRGDKFVVTADVPGFEKDEIDVQIVDDRLSITARHGEEREEEEGTYLRSERERRMLGQSVRLPEPVDEDHVTARIKNGVLTVTLPKIEPSEMDGKHIEIE